MISCEEAAKQLNAYLDRELTLETVKLVEEHIRHCQRCIGRLNFDKAVRRAVRNHLVRRSLSASVKTLIREKMRR